SLESFPEVLAYGGSLSKFGGEQPEQQASRGGTNQRCSSPAAIRKKNGPQHRTHRADQKYDCHVSGVDASPRFARKSKDEALTAYLIYLYGGINDDRQKHEQKDRTLSGVERNQECTRQRQGRKSGSRAGIAFVRQMTGN